MRGSSLAREFGAEFAINAAKEDSVEAIQRLGGVQAKVWGPYDVFRYTVRGPRGSSEPREATICSNVASPASESNRKPLDYKLLDSRRSDVAAGI
jgi:hypothetical protein